MPGYQYHVPVLLNEAAEYLLTNVDTSVNRVYIDCTLGGGGYTKRILEKTSGTVSIISFDKDINAIEFSREYLNNYSQNVTFINENFAGLKRVLSQLNIHSVAGIVMDLGLSTYQLNSEPGFSYQQDTELDMRADRRMKLKAKDVLNTYSLDELIRIFRDYGELKYNRQVSRDIIEYRNNNSFFESTFDLVNLLSKKIPPRYLNSDLSRIFQALRIEVNGELEDLRIVLNDGADMLEPSGRIVCVSYHSLEDRIIKNLFRQNNNLKIITKKPVTASAKEINNNIKARSAKLRTAEKKGGNA